jgi:hypothetical protein
LQGEKRQLNLWISRDAFATLKAAAYVDDVRSPSGLAVPVIEKYAARRSKEEKVAAAKAMRSTE